MCLIFSALIDNIYIKIQKSMEFECGFNSITINRLSFSLQYFIIRILFLVFDLEIILILPVIEEIKKSYLVLNFLFFLLTLLILGLFIEWFYGMVDWRK